METTRLKHLYVEGLKDLYSAENQLLKALPKMAKASTFGDLRAGFEEHLNQTKEHVARLEKIFSALGENPKGKKCRGMEGLIKEGAAMIEEFPAPDELDAGLISAAQRVEHYEIAGYGCVSTYAKCLGEDQAVSLLRQTLSEEIEADKKLSQLADRINLKAANSKESDGGSSQSREGGDGLGSPRLGPIAHAHNIKITQDGKVTLRGPVRSEDEKNNLQAKGVAVAGEENVRDQLEIVHSK